MLLPQLAKEAKITSLEHYINDDRWVMEQKLDGHRLLICSPGGDYPPTALTRSGSAYTRKLPKEIQDFRFPKKHDGTHYGPGEWVLDGELVGTVVNGHTISSTYWVFDLPATPYDVNLTGMRLADRRTMLESFFDVCPNPFRLTPQARTKDEKVALAEKAVANNFEGLLLKHTEAPYRSGGRTEEWLKVKFVTTADCIVLDVRDDGKDSVRLGMVTGDDLDSLTIVDVGRASLIGKEKNGVINKGDVLEVRYLYTGAGGRLYQPTILKKRDDKAMHECHVQQLKHVNKAVLETL